MKFLILLGIRFYWILIPEKKRKKCIFKVSCSHHVYNVTKKYGFFKGLYSFFLRRKQCRKGYNFYFADNGDVIIQLADGSKIKEDTISEILTKEVLVYKKHLKNVKLSL